MKTLALYNLKGGVGKTAASVNLSYFAAAAGCYTLLWDLDPQGASSWYLHGEAAGADARKLLSGSAPLGRLVQPTPYERLSVVPAEFSFRYLDVLLRKTERGEATLRKLIRPFSEQFSLTVLDCPPSLSHLADNVFEAADLIVVPVIPTPLSLRAYEQLREYFQEQGYDLGKLRPFYSMVDRRRQLHRELLEQPPALMRGALPPFVPYSSMVERMGEARAPLAAYAPSDDAALNAYAELWLEIERILKP